MLTVILGSRPHVLVLPEAPVELHVEDVFVAANRIGDTRDDMERLLHPWQRQLRNLLDHAGAPSMSVGDMIWFTSESGEELGGIQCLSNGWVNCRSKRAQAINGGHLCFAS